MSYKNVEGVKLETPLNANEEDILTQQALNFLSKLHRQFNTRRLELLQLRSQRQQEINALKAPDFLPETKAIREDASWRVAPTPPDLQNRKVEITGPAEKKNDDQCIEFGS